MTIQESRVLVLYTGGTIGMLNTERGFTPSKGFLLDWLRSQTAFNDPSAQTVASNAHSQATYQAWAAGQIEPPKPKEGGRPKSILGDERNTLVTPVFRFGGMMKKISVSGNSVSLLNLKEPDRGLGSIDDPLVGSSSIDSFVWKRLANDIESNASDFDGFVILHGTDTMVYTASALAFLLNGLYKPVVLTGAQIPLCEYSSDAPNNFRGALLSAGMGDLREVCIFFNRKLMRGCRTRKVSSFELDAFDSPLMDPLLETDVEHSHKRPTTFSDARNFLMTPVPDMSAEVMILHIWPGMTASQLKSLLSNPDVKGVVMQTFGAGNFPLIPEMLDVLKEAIKAGLLVVNVSQCARGKVLPIYMTGVILSEIGVVAGNDMTPECAFVKLSYLLAQPHLSLEEKKRWLATCMIGEMTSVVV